METEILLIVVFFVGLALGVHLGLSWSRMAFYKILQELNVSDKQLKQVARNNGIEVEDDGKEPELTEYEITIEQHGDQLYAFKTDGEFIGQGADKEALVTRIAERFHNVKFRIAAGAEFLK